MTADQRTAAAAAGSGELACREDRSPAMSRRTLFRIAGAAGAVTATTLSGARVAVAAPSDADVLVVLSLRGGFDGLAALAPVGDPDYRTSRPTTGTPPSAAKKVDQLFGLHPAMAPLFPLWDAGKVAAVHAVGQERATRSHVAAIEALERAGPPSLASGWIDRMLGVVGGEDAAAATQVGSPTLPRSLVGPNPKFAVSNVKDLRLVLEDKFVPLEHLQKAMARLHEGGRPEVSVPLTAALRAVGTVRPLGARDRGAVASGYPEGRLGEALHDVALLIKEVRGLRVATLDFAGWDMHAGQGGVDDGPMTAQLAELSASLAAFAKDLGSSMDRVTLVTLSEFGRRVAENGSGGTDHGHGNALLLLGGGVRGGGVYGRWPGLAPDKLVDGDLAGTTDYRTVLAEVLAKRCGVAATSKVFPGFSARPLGLATQRG